MRPCPRSLLCAVALGAGIAAFVDEAYAQGTRFVAPNMVAISPRLVTSGQPSAEALAELKADGFEAVINLASPGVLDPVRDEPLIVTRQGLAYVIVPIALPGETDYDMFASVLRGLANRKVLVHCQINQRASVMVFLYRVIVFKEDPKVAYEAVSSVWVPDGPWRQLIEDELRKHKVDFEIF